MFRGRITWGSSAGSCPSVSITSEPSLWEGLAGKMGFPPAANAFTEHTTDLFQAGFPGREALTTKRSKAKPRLGTPHKNMNLCLKSLLSGQQLCWANISYSCFSGKPLCSSTGLGLLWGTFHQLAVEHWSCSCPRSVGGQLEGEHPPPGYPRCDAVYQALVSASLDHFQWGSQSPLS